MSSSVLVTGATGFIAQHIVAKLLAKSYNVIGTARSQEKATTLIENFKKLYPDGKLSVEIVPDIAAENAFDSLFEKHTEIKQVLHTASPFSFGLKTNTEEGYLKPALNGTMNVLHAIKKYAPQVTNVVITSSSASVQHGPFATNDFIHSNKTWNEMTWEQAKDNEFAAYVSSKTEAEKAARKFYAEEKPNYKLGTVNPCMVIGPQLFDWEVPKTLNTSNEMLNAIAHFPPEMPGPFNQFPLYAVDVRDVAEFHILELEKEALAEERAFLASENFVAQKILNILNDNFPELNGKIPKGDYESADKLIEELCPKFDCSYTLDKVPGYKLISLEKMVVDTFKQYFSKYPVA